jgi:hypothetical protein
MEVTKRDYWRRCDVDTLIHHFHRFDGRSQFDRLEAVHLDKNLLEILFPPEKDIHSFDIDMGLDSVVSVESTYTFSPTIRVKYNDDESAMTEKVFIQGIPPDLRDSSQVPVVFKEWVVKNWMELKLEWFDDVFTAALKRDSPEERKKTPFDIMTSHRLLGYHFTDTINDSFLEFIREHRGNLDLLVFHMGVDMNKFQHKELFSFSPVFEVHVRDLTEEQVRELRSAGLRCIPKAKKGEEVVYYEYSAPCPSTC